MTTRLQDKAYYTASQVLWNKTGRKLRISELRGRLCRSMQGMDYNANNFASEKDVRNYVKKVMDTNHIKYTPEDLRAAYEPYAKQFDAYADQGLDLIMASDPRKHVNEFMANDMQRPVIVYDADSYDMNQRKIDVTNVQIVDDPNRLNRERTKDMSNLRISPWANGINKDAKRLNRSVEDVTKERHQAIGKLPIWVHRDEVEKDQKMNHAGSKKNGYDQIIEKLGPYLSVQDQNTLREIIVDDNRHYDETRLEQSARLLEHMTDNDIEFEVSPNSFVGNKGESVDVKVTNAPISGRAPSVRLIDDTQDHPEQSYVGSVFVGEGSYHYVQPYNRPGYMPEHPEYLIDMVMGKKQFNTHYTSKELRKVRFDVGVPGQAVTYSRHVYGNTRQLIQPDLNQETADEKINDAIIDARNEYYNVFNGPDLDEIDYSLAEEQAKMRDYLSENDFDEDVLNDAIRQVHGEDLGDDYHEGAYAVADKLREMADEYCGVPEHDENHNPYEKDRAINFTHVASLVSRNTVYSNDDELINAYKHSSWTTDDLLDEDYALNHVKEQLVEFNPETAHGLDDAKSDFERDLLMHVQSTLHDTYSIVGNTGDYSLPDVQLDDKGVLKWSGRRSVGTKHEVREVHGEIGQIFLPDEKGILHTNFAAEDENFDMVPGIKGFFIHDGLEEGKSRMERFRGEGFEQSLYAKVDGAIQRQVLREDDNGNLAAPTDSTMLNKLYHGDLYGKRLEANWYENSKLKDYQKDAIIETLKGRIRLPNSIGHSANSFLEVGGHGREAGEGDGISALVDDKNIRKLDDDYIGYFDMVMTGTNKSQGLVLYLGEGAKLNHDGTVTPVTDKDGKPVQVNAPLRNLDEFKYSNSNPWDRNQMASNQVMTANDITDDTHLMLATAGGWTFEDSCLVSKKWAEEHLVKGADGEMRPLMIGDKISDMSGNKSTIGMVVDPDMDPDEAYVQKLTNEVDLFNQNPDLDVVMSPYSVISRQNAGIVKELCASNDKQPVTLVDSNGKTHDVGVMGTAHMIVTDMLADQKTHVYGHDALKDGHGRKASSQLVWSMNELQLNDTMKDLFRGNESAWSATREKLLATGLDMDKDGNLQVGYHPHEDEEREVFTVDVDPESEKLSDGNQASKDFIYQLSNKGGLLQLPCEIKTGIDDEKTDLIPIMSAGLRRNRELINGETQISDATRNYGQLYKNAWNYQFESQHENREEKLEKYQQGMQQAYNNIRNEVIMKDLGGYNGETAKHSFVKEHLMSKRQAESATAVQTADPRLPLDTVKISPEIRETLNLKKNDVIMIERDPALRGSALLAMKWEEDPNINGVAVNPTLAGMYDGDFDGDTLGCLVAHSRKAQDELKAKAMVEHRLTDPGNGGTILNASMDMISAGLKTGLLKPTNEDAQGRDPETQLNDHIEMLQKSAADDHEAMELLSDLTTGATLHNVENFGAASIDITSEETAKESVKQIVATGAKGSPAKAQEFNDYMDGKKTLKDAQEVQLATGAKSDGTGLAGANSQRLMSALRDIDPVTALEVTYPNTQAVLQVKHDAQMGRVILGALTHQLPNLFNGRDKDASDGEKVPMLSRTEWTKQMKDVYNNTLGLHGLDEHIDDLGKLLSDSRDNIQPVRTVAAQRANLLDQWAYGGGYKVLEDGAKNGRNLAAGRNIQPLVPESLRNKDKDIMLKKDMKKVKEVEQTVEATEPTKTTTKATTKKKSVEVDLEM